MEILEDSTGLRDRPDQLQKRIATDGYIFLRRAVDPERVTTVRHHILEALGRLGWLARGSEPEEALPGESIRREGDDEWWGGYAAIQSLESFHELAHDPAIVAVVQQGASVEMCGNFGEPEAAPGAPEEQGRTFPVTLPVIRRRTPCEGKVPRCPGGRP
jgi:hypothetical protein